MSIFVRDHEFVNRGRLVTASLEETGKRRMSAVKSGTVSPAYGLLPDVASLVRLHGVLGGASAKFQTRRAFFRVFFGTVFFALLAVLLAALAFLLLDDFLLLDFLLAAFFTAAFVVLAFVVLAFVVLALVVLALAALAFVALAAGAPRAFFAARFFRRAGVAATGGTIRGSDTSPSAASGT
jgi:hypothetical protein